MRAGIVALIVFLADFASAQAAAFFECVIKQTPGLLDNGIIEPNSTHVWYRNASRKLVIDKQSGHVVHERFAGWSWTLVQRGSSENALIALGRTVVGTPDAMVFVYQYRASPEVPFLIFSITGVFEMVTGTCR
ncbi:MAG TPA: hypothetical protein VFQ27_01630 [Xanthobacteraceae bacterium]|nr:hypothetical protein [Xanthobacteraceae bacterium]